MSDRMYRLCGFSSGVDWRPVTFKEPLPPSRLCNLCGIVSMKMAMLACGHILCSGCLERRAEEDGHYSCPLDRAPLDEDLSWINPPQDQLATLQVTCWNSEHGCDFVGPLEQLLDHFEQRCGFHSARCPRCRNSMPQKGLPGHYIAGCSAIPLPVAEVQETAAALTSADPLPVAVVPESAAALGPSEPRFESSAASCHDILLSIQRRVNELAEAPGSSRGGCHEVARGNDATEASSCQEAGPLAVRPVHGCSERAAITVSLHETVSAVTEAFVKMRRLESAMLAGHSLSDSLPQGGQTTDTVVTESGTAGEKAFSRGSGDINSRGAAEKLIVWTLAVNTENLHQECMVSSAHLQFQDIPDPALDVNVEVNLHMFGIYSVNADTVAVYADVGNICHRTKKCEVVSVERLSCDEVHAPSYWVRSELRQLREYNAGLPLRYMCSFKTHSQNISEHRYKFDFLIKMMFVSKKQGAELS